MCLNRKGDPSQGPTVESPRSPPHEVQRPRTPPQHLLPGKDWSGGGGIYGTNAQPPGEHTAGYNWNPHPQRALPGSQKPQCSPRGASKTRRDRGSSERDPRAFHSPAWPPSATSFPVATKRLFHMQMGSSPRGGALPPGNFSLRETPCPESLPETDATHLHWPRWGHISHLNNPNKGNRIVVTKSQASLPGAGGVPQGIEPLTWEQNRGFVDKEERWGTVAISVTKAEPQPDLLNLQSGLLVQHDPSCGVTEHLTRGSVNGLRKI